MSLQPTEGNVLAILKAAPEKKLAYPELSKRFDNNVELLTLLWRMRQRPIQPVRFNDGWITVDELVVRLD